ncbi:MAG: FkbM family methyltransferase [Limnohabitans sp.]|jgi:FkbM family methyltransferase|uniref:FkbM family methyltransferase n=1 Tax=Limnohabitans sp. TaxID=1907725 RepID=UPI003918E453
MINEEQPMRTRSLERRFKAMLPHKLKRKFAKLLCSDGLGNVVKKSGIKFNLFGGYFNYELVSKREAAKIFLGIWESAEIRFAKRFARNENIVELGSSVGVMLGVLSNLFDHARFICVEASPVNFRKLNQLCRELNPSLNVTLINKAVAYGSKVIHFDQTSTTGSRIQRSAIAQGERIAVEAVTLSEILENEKVDGWYTLITDIEGAEADIFFKDISALAKCNKIIAELEPISSTTVEDQINQITAIGFELIERYGDVVYFQRNGAR